MRTARLTLALALAAAFAAASPPPVFAQPVSAQAVQPKAGWYRALVDFDFVHAHVAIPPKKAVMLVDSRPAARQYDPGHIPGAVNIPDTQFDKLVDRLPPDKSTLLVFYCGGYDCMLSHNSAFKAEKLGYTNVRVYAAGMPEWKGRGAQVSVSAAHIQKLIDEKARYLLVDARPRRVAEKGMIPTAVNIPDTEFDKLAGQLPADKSTPLVFYCGGLECVLSDHSAARARKLGYTEVLTYPEGHPEWLALKGGLAAAAPAPAAAPVTGLVAGKEKGSVTVDSFLHVWRTNPSSLLLVDVRDAREFANGTIPGAVSLPVDELEKKVGTLPADRPVVFLCGTGARSGEAYDIVKLARRDVQAWFLDAVAKFNGDGGYALTQK